MRRLLLLPIALLLVTACSSGTGSEDHSGHTGASASATPDVVALDLVFDDGTAGVAQVLSTPDAVEIQVALPDVVASSITARLTAPSVEGIDLDLEETAGGVWRGTTALVPGTWDLLIEASRDEDGFLSTATAATTFDLPQEQ